MPIEKTASPHTVTKSIAIHAPAANVWHVLTNSESIREWVSDEGGLAVQSDWIVGHPFALVGTFHGMQHHDQGTLLALTHSNLVTLPIYQHANFYWNAT